MTAICIRCGREKRRPWTTCGRCGLDPRPDPEALVRSVYLSLARFEASPALQHAYRVELREAARRIETGTGISFDERELERLRAERDLVRRVPRSAVIGALVRLFGPAILFLAALYGAVWVLRWQLRRR